MLPYLTAYKTHGCIKRTAIPAGQIKKKQSTNIKCDEINIMRSPTLLYFLNGL